MEIVQEYFDFLQAKGFPCIAAKAALSREHIHCFQADHMACPHQDADVLHFLYQFIQSYRKSKERFWSAAVIFKNPRDITEKQFDELLWSRLNSLRQLDQQNFVHDPRVDSDPASINFGFSLMSEALFIIGLNPSSKRKSRQFKYPALIFNPHQEFEKLRKSGKFEGMKRTVRKRDVSFSGSVNPMLKDFGQLSEVYQYSGITYDDNWKCPLRK
jgi:FPC/CPF motif-containing protein YcgG